MFDCEDNPEYGPSDLDEIRISEMEIGESVVSEAGFWTVHRYPKEYCLIFDAKSDIKEFKTYQELIRYLKEF